MTEVGSLDVPVDDILSRRLLEKRGREGGREGGREEGREGGREEGREE